LWLRLKFNTPETVWLQRGLLVWAGAIGILGALSSVAFRSAIGLMQVLLTSRSGGVVEAAMALSTGERLLVPCIGGALSGLIIVALRRFAGSQPATDFMEAIVLGDGRMPVRPIVARCLSALVSIASGGAMGREGPMVQLSSMLASAFGRRIGVRGPRLRLLVACGVAAGIASAYRAPIAGSLFVAEIVLGSIAMESFGPLVFAAVTATLTVRQLGEAGPLYGAVNHQLRASWEIIPFVFVGVLAGVLAPGFLAALARSRAAFLRLHPSPIVRLSAGGLGVGLLSVFCPEVWGNGYALVRSLLEGPGPFSEVLLTATLKLLAVLMTVGSGAIGGVFTPTLCMGASLGSLFARAYHLAWAGPLPDAAAYALVGMGAFLAATTHAPLMAILMIFEMTLDYDVVLPLMLACVASFFTASALGARSIYAEPLGRRPLIKPSWLGVTSDARGQLVAEALGVEPVAVCCHDSFEQVARLFVKSGAQDLFVTDEEQVLVGLISLSDVQGALEETYPKALVRAWDIMRADTRHVTPGTPLTEAAAQFLRDHRASLPVVQDGTARKLVGVLTREDVALALAHGADEGLG
jgi:CIC family chloride channel protein